MGYHQKLAPELQAVDGVLFSYADDVDADESLVSSF